MSAEAIVEARGVGKSYDGGVEALKDVSLALPRGKLSTLLGPSGCGKTTLLKIIAGLIPPSRGEVWVKGMKVEGPGPERAFVFQDFALLPWANVLRNVAFGLELRGTPKEQRDEIARRQIAEVGLSSFESSYPHQLSGGMRQRVGLARALAVDADIILMDEPFSSLDAVTREDLQHLTLSLCREQGLTLVIVTHSIEEAVGMGKKILVLGDAPNQSAHVFENPDAGQSGYPDSPACRELCDLLWREMHYETA